MMSICICLAAGCCPYELTATTLIGAMMSICICLAADCCPYELTAATLIDAVMSIESAVLCRSTGSCNLCHSTATLPSPPGMAYMLSWSCCRGCMAVLLLHCKLCRHARHSAGPWGLMQKPLDSLECTMSRRQQRSVQPALHFFTSAQVPSCQADYEHGQSTRGHLFLLQCPCWLALRRHCMPQIRNKIKHGES